jgi:hydroxypyruvate reductase
MIVWTLPRSIIEDNFRNIVVKVVESAIRSVQPENAVKKFCFRDAGVLCIGDKRYSLEDISNVYVVAVGKASLSMAKAAVEILGDQFKEGVVITKHVDPQLLSLLPATLRVMQGSHPVPDQRSVDAAVELNNLLMKATPRDLVLCLISGGGSSLVTLPVEGVSLDELQLLTRALLACGAEIGEINALRKHLDRVKGGGLIRMAHGVPVASLILSDVIGNPLDVIASGPTVADSTTYEDTLRILEKYRLSDKIPASIFNYLTGGSRGEQVETLKPGDPLFAQVQNEIIASNLQAASAAVGEARELGLNSLLLTTYLKGEASQVGEMLAGVLRQVCATGEPVQRPACIVAGGETTVTLKGNGIGGRNLEVALGAVRELSGLENILMVTFATDGEDGPSQAAGAAVTGKTLERGISAGLHLDGCLLTNDSLAYFQALGDVWITGPTGTNVNDLTFLFAF